MTPSEAMTPSELEKLSDEFLDSVCAIPNGQKIKQCIQCGTCSASCPSAAAMEYSPREIIAALRAGMLDRVLSSNTVWMCVSCYSCAVRCPAGIPFTDVMYELKRLGGQKGLSKDTNAATVAQAFVETVDHLGRNAETNLLRKYYLRTNPFKALAQIPLVIKLLVRGRLEMFPKRIKGLDGLHKMMASIEKNGSK
jgi:heterodisulfide reductase subunit C